MTCPIKSLSMKNTCIQSITVDGWELKEQHDKRIVIVYM